MTDSTINATNTSIYEKFKSISNIVDVSSIVPEKQLSKCSKRKPGDMTFDDSDKENSQITEPPPPLDEQIIEDRLYTQTFKTENEYINYLAHHTAPQEVDSRAVDLAIKIKKELTAPFPVKLLSNTKISPIYQNMILGELNTKLRLDSKFTNCWNIIIPKMCKIPKITDVKQNDTNEIIKEDKDVKKLSEKICQKKRKLLLLNNNMKWLKMYNEYALRRETEMVQLFNKKSRLRTESIYQKNQKVILGETNITLASISDKGFAKPTLGDGLGEFKQTIDQLKQIVKNMEEIGVEAGFVENKLD